LTFEDQLIACSNDPVGFSSASRAFPSACQYIGSPPFVFFYLCPAKTHNLYTLVMQIGTISVITIRFPASESIVKPFCFCSLSVAFKKEKKAQTCVILAAQYRMPATLCV